ncbi:MAG: hypothetical protein CME60_01340 [Halobacteriovoraceae bacterium]|nr:hypothetical protein [Halobacteriovoraceae bacterium]
MKIQIMVKENKVKKLLLFSLFLLSFNGHALTIQWFGTTCLAITYKKQTILLDPFFNRPSLLQILSPFSYQPNPQVVDQWLITLPEESKLEAILTSHSHYDHILDAPYLLEKTQAHFYGSETAIHIIHSPQINSERLHRIDYKKKFTRGDFKITPFAGEHPPHIFNYIWANGKRDKPLKKPAPLYQYKMGKVYNFLIETPEGTVLFHPSAYPSKQITDVLKHKKIDILVLGIANRRSSLELIENVVKPSKAQFLITGHHDDLFEKMKLTKKAQQIPLLLSSDYDEWSEALSKEVPSLKSLELTYSEKFKLPK